jgi:hypothetical protein
MIKKVILGVLAFILVVTAALSVVVAMQTEDFKVTRTATMNAAPAQVFEQVNDFHQWEAWSPWAKIDPNMKTTFGGPASGKDASYSWVGNDDVGEGKMVIAASQPTEHIAIDLEFIKPFAAKNVSEFLFKPDGGKTNVTWTMTGKKNFIMKAVCLVMDMDKMVGPDFEKGLAQMKTVVEAAPKPQ